MGKISSNDAFKLHKSVDRKHMIKFIHKKINGRVPKLHIIAVINILFEEMSKYIEEEKIIDITNLGKLFLNKMPPKKYFNVVTQKVEQSNGSHLLKFEITRKLKKRLLKMLDMEKTFPEKFLSGEDDAKER